MHFRFENPAQMKRVAELMTFYADHRSEGTRVVVRDTVFTSETMDMNVRDATAHEGPFKGMVIVCTQTIAPSGGVRTSDRTIIAPNGESISVE